MKKLLLVIENKIDAGDQMDQLKRYRFWMDRLDSDFTQRCLIYLTLEGRKCEDADRDQIVYCPLSYKDDITNWLDQSRRSIQADAVLHTINQYLSAISDLCSPNDTDYKSEVQEYLKLPENLGFACEVSDNLEMLKDRLIAKFWTALRDSVRNDDSARGWVVGIRNENCHVNVWNLDAFPRTDQYLKITVVQEGRYVFYGILRDKPAQGRGIPAMAGLPFELPGSSTEWVARGPWVAVRQLLPHGFRDCRFLIEREYQVKQIADAVCKLIEAGRKFIEGI
jgi:hypothetical protein